MSLTDEQKAQLSELLDAAKADGFAPKGYVSQDTLVGRLKDKDRANATALADAEARLSERETNLNAALERLNEYESKNKTAEEKLSEQLRARDDKIAAYEAKVRAEGERADTEARERRNLWLDTKLAALFPRAANVAHAVAIARLEHPSLAVEDADGQYRLSLSVDGLPVDDAKAALGDWWQEQHHLQGKRGSELPIGGGHAAPGDPPQRDPLDGLTAGQMISIGMSQHGSTKDPQGGGPRY